MYTGMWEMILGSCAESKGGNINWKNNVIELVKWKKIKKRGFSQI